MIQKLAQALLKPINTAAIIILAGLTFTWGVWVASPFWNTFTTAPIFADISSMAGEGVWGLIAMLVGVLMARGVFKPSYINLLIGSITGFFFWLVISFLYFTGDWQNTGGLVSAWLAVYCAFIWLNIVVNKPFKNKT